MNRQFFFLVKHFTETGVSFRAKKRKERNEMKERIVLQTTLFAARKPFPIYMRQNERKTSATDRHEMKMVQYIDETVG